MSLYELTEPIIEVQAMAVIYRGYKGTTEVKCNKYNT